VYAYRGTSLIRNRGLGVHKKQGVRRIEDGEEGEGVWRLLPDELLIFFITLEPRVE